MLPQDQCYFMQWRRIGIYGLRCRYEKSLTVFSAHVRATSRPSDFFRIPPMPLCSCYNILRAFLWARFFRAKVSFLEPSSLCPAQADVPRSAAEFIDTCARETTCDSCLRSGCAWCNDACVPSTSYDAFECCEDCGTCDGRRAFKVWSLPRFQNV
jgi:hypothetical protein